MRLAFKNFLRNVAVKMTGNRFSIAVNIETKCTKNINSFSLFYLILHFSIYYIGKNAHEGSSYGRFIERDWLFVIRK